MRREVGQLKGGVRMVKAVKGLSRNKKRLQYSNTELEECTRIQKYTVFNCNGCVKKLYM